ncbi:TPA: AbrB/MazE/SpoVT family DNA-binding domain-containing protein [Clostridioides difficile]|uniref:AbrB/MazE/SpoVT family DNA-binding domain-containing protein n=1 Tax=Clostridioides difficile TaxID=1496 RepID=UPI001C17A676|nr:AbrB/MazE/SpoVT family DNA-binding domain-containing protein [Clostridioides difficile]MCU5872549.1 AbrB/MazE/SpoVT family DNA-binding domain-containing protein [Clostridioides difficile]MCU5898872.1 AbrB/MazE/SpoVT family DNA-binding domain-containing protein [Clostridioides difficile]MDV9591473.1 AbrB/MazE/SpoVT family DNA-binding domain-containing protein [Clostridioides difficile]HBE9110450.1 AbrB/MazE/SpoVT family DNA-binding domain-containing protein [Clostridioides difficile]HBF52393
MEQRELNISFHKSGNGYTTTRLSLPINWVKKLGISQDERKVIVTLEDGKIIIEKAENE